MKLRKIVTSIALMAAMIGAQGASARETINAKGAVTVETHEVKNFHSITNKSVGKVIYSEGDASRVKISGPRNVIPYIEVVCNDGKLVIRHKKNVNIRLNGKRLEIFVTGKGVKTYGVAGSGDIIVPEAISGDELSFGISGSGDIEVRGVVKAGRVNAGISGSGDIEMRSVDASDVKCGITGSGDIEIEMLRGDVLDCGIMGSGDIKVDAHVKSVSAGITGSGDVVLIGTANTAKYGVSESGDIKASNMVASDVEAGANGSGDIFCHATNRLAATSTATGNVVYKGNPSKVTAGRNVKKDKRK